MTTHTTRTRQLLLAAALVVSGLVAAPSTATAATAAPAAAPHSAAPHSAATTGTPAATRSAGHRVVHRDARRDVVRVAGRKHRRTPYDRTTDIVGTVVDHRAERLVLKVRLRRLVLADYRFVIAGIRTSDSQSYDAMLDLSRTSTGSRVLVVGDATSSTCRGTSWHLSRATGTVTMTIPRTCLGDPRWVRVGLGMVSTSKDFSTTRADDSRRRGGLDLDLVRGPRQPHA